MCAPISTPVSRTVSSNGICAVAPDGLLGRVFVFQALLNPLAAVVLRKMHEFSANGAAVNAPRFVRYSSLDANFREAASDGPAKWVKFGVHVSPAAKQIKHTFAFQGLGFADLEFCAWSHGWWCQ